MKLPRVKCPGCERDVAAVPVSGQPTKGALWRHDHPSQRRDENGDLVSCSRSWEIVDLPAGNDQLALDLDAPDTAPTARDEGTLALF